MKEEKYFTEEETVWYHDGGFEETALFLHGYLSCKESFYYQKKFFEQGFNVLIPDLPGFKEKTKLVTPYGLEDYAVWVENLLKRYNVKEVSVVAHSFGARVFFKLFARGNVKINRAVFVGAAGMKPRFSLIKKIKIARYKLRKKIGLDVSEFGSDDYKRLDETTRASFVKIINERLEKDVKKVDVPALIIAGKKDEETPVYMQKKLHKLIKGSKLVKVNGDHFYFCKKPREFNERAYAFLKGELR